LTELGRRRPWQAVEVVEVVEETPAIRTLVLDAPGWSGHRAGQSVDVRLTDATGYSTQRPYSIASAPEDERLELTVERLEDGEVSSYLAGELQVGDRFEIRGPGGRSFSWHVEDGGPLLLVAGGAGLVPLRAMLRHRLAQGADLEICLVLSVRSEEELLYRDELAAWEAADVRVVVTFHADGAAAPCRPRAARGSRAGGARVRVRLDGVRRGGRRAARRARPRPRPGADRALRRGRVTLLPSPA
jgi:NAD(P)H-flavin reductase